VDRLVLKNSGEGGDGLTELLLYEVFDGGLQKMNGSGYIDVSGW
jgi:hypothetical protein